MIVSKKYPDKAVSKCAVSIEAASSNLAYALISVGGVSAVP